MSYIIYKKYYGTRILIVPHSSQYNCWAECKYPSWTYSYCPRQTIPSWLDLFWWSSSTSNLVVEKEHLGQWMISPINHMLMSLLWLPLSTALLVSYDSRMDSLPRNNHLCSSSHNSPYSYDSTTGNESTGIPSTSVTRPLTTLSYTAFSHSGCSGGSVACGLWWSQSRLTLTVLPQNLWTNNLPHTSVSYSPRYTLLNLCGWISSLCSAKLSKLLSHGAQYPYLPRRNICFIENTPHALDLLFAWRTYTESYIYELIYILTRND